MIIRLACVITTKVQNYIDKIKHLLASRIAQLQHRSANIKYQRAIKALTLAVSQSGVCQCLPAVQKLESLGLTIPSNHSKYLHCSSKCLIFITNLSYCSFSQYLLHILKMTKCTLVFSILSLVVLLIITGIHGAPAAIALTTKSLDKEPSPANQMIFNILPSPPLAREEREIIPTISTPDTAPKYFSFIKVHLCYIHGCKTRKEC